MVKFDAALVEGGGGGEREEEGERSSIHGRSRCKLDCNVHKYSTNEN